LNALSAPVEGLKELVLLVRARKPGETVEVEMIRKGERIVLPVLLEEPVGE
jgi:S1-C subfamily serine protease